MSQAGRMGAPFNIPQELFFSPLSFLVLICDCVTMEECWTTVSRCPADGLSLPFAPMAVSPPEELHSGEGMKTLLRSRLELYQSVSVVRLVSFSPEVIGLLL